MRVNRLFVFVALVASLLMAGGASAEGETGWIGVYSVAACKDSTTVAVSGWTTYRNNRVRAAIHYRDGDGNEVMLHQLFTPAFDAGKFSLVITLPYEVHPVAAGTLMWIDVQLQHLGGDTYWSHGNFVRHYVAAADRNCFGLCSVTVDTSDLAPADGTITLRSRYGSWFRPEGQLLGALPVSEGRAARITFVGLPCGQSVRAWYYPQTGDTTPRMLPSQYWPYEYQITGADGTNPYTTSFQSGLAPTRPLEDDDPYVVKLPGASSEALPGHCTPPVGAG